MIFLPAWRTGRRDRELGLEYRNITLERSMLVPYVNPPTMERHKLNPEVLREGLIHLHQDSKYLNSFSTHLPPVLSLGSWVTLSHCRIVH